MILLYYLSNSENSLSRRYIADAATALSTDLGTNVTLRV